MGVCESLSSVTVSPESIARYDCIVVATHHDAFDWALIKQHAQLIADTRGVLGALRKCGEGLKDSIVPRPCLGARLQRRDSRMPFGYQRSVER